MPKLPPPLSPLSLNIYFVLKSPLFIYKLFYLQSFFTYGQSTWRMYVGCFWWSGKPTVYRFIETCRLSKILVLLYSYNYNGSLIYSSSH